MMKTNRCKRIYALNCWLFRFYVDPTDCSIVDRSKKSTKNGVNWSTFCIVFIGYRFNVSQHTMNGIHLFSEKILARTLFSACVYLSLVFCWNLVVIHDVHNLKNETQIKLTLFQIHLNGESCFGFGSCLCVYVCRLSLTDWSIQSRAHKISSILNKTLFKLVQ